MGGNRRGKKKAPAGDDPERAPDVAVHGAIEDVEYVSPIPAPETVLVCDPATKQRITLRWEETQHTAGRAILLENLAEGRKKESYLCMLYQKGMCRSHQRCNQLHADKGRVTELRQEYFQAHGKHGQGQDEPLAHQRALEVVVVDPADNSNRITLPFAKTADTEGRREYFKTQQTRGGALREFRICPCFLAAASSTCEVGTRCPHIHADRSFVKHINEAKPCCPFHGDVQSKVTGFRGRLFMVNKNNQRCPVPLERVAATKGSRELFPASGQIIFACNRVCRLHQEKHCPWGSECANLHICREFYATFSNCAKPSLVSLPSQPGLQILPSGKLRPIPGAAAAEPEGPDAGLGLNPVAGVPLSPAGASKEAFAIPLVTLEGPVPRRLLCEQALRRYPSAGQQPQPMQQQQQQQPQQPGWPRPAAGGMAEGDAPDQMGWMMAACLKMMQDAPQGQATMVAMAEAYRQMAVNGGVMPQQPQAGMPMFPPFPPFQAPPQMGSPSHSHNPHPVPTRSQPPAPRPTESDHSRGAGSSQFSGDQSGRVQQVPLPVPEAEIPSSLRQVAYADSEPEDDCSEGKEEAEDLPATNSHQQPLPFTASNTSSLAPPPLGVASSALDAVHSSMSPSVSGTFGPIPSGTAPGVPPPHAMQYAPPLQPIQSATGGIRDAVGLRTHSSAANYQSPNLPVTDSFRSRSGQHLPYGPQ